MLAQLVKLRAQALASLLTSLSSGLSQLAHLVKLGLQCQFSCWFGATHSGITSTTTQSNSGFSGGLVGGFGATHSGSTSTIIGTSGSNYALRKKGNPLMLSPYSGSIDSLSLIADTLPSGSVVPPNMHLPTLYPWQ
jgi:hypothetical protein